jgi:hypothetical protein
MNTSLENAGEVRIIQTGSDSGIVVVGSNRPGQIIDFIPVKLEFSYYHELQSVTLDKKPLRSLLIDAAEIRPTPPDASETKTKMDAHIAALQKQLAEIQGERERTFGVN